MFALLPLLLFVAGCGRAATDSPVIRLNDNAVEVSGLSGATLDALASAGISAEQWPAILRVAVAEDGPPMLGSYVVANGVLRFEPAFPLDPGRQYLVRFDAAQLPGATASAAAAAATVGLPAVHRSPSTVVTRIYPTGDEVPENVLRMYIEFSGAMGRKSGVEYIKLLNDQGDEIPGAVLPLEYEFWSPDHRRFTVFFDPGRVKQGILPNREMGRAFTRGRTATLVISADWRDEHGQPLKQEYRRTFRVGAVDVDPIDTASWRITPPAASGRDPVVVSFPEPLDHGLLMRALGIRRSGDVVSGEAEVTRNETEWRFTPAAPWRSGTYHLLALDILEDLAGNQIGKAFEVDTFDTVDKSPNPETVEMPFVVR